LRLGMFVTTTFYGLKKQSYATVPASAVLHLHDHDWVYVPIDGGRFQRVEVVAGKLLPGAANVGASGAPPGAEHSPALQSPGELQQIKSGIRPGQKVVADALNLQTTVEQ